MGIKNLHRFLKKYAETAYKEIPLSEYANRSIAIDINIYIYRYKSMYKNKWLNVFLTFILTLKKHNIQCIFIYDTKAPIEKNAKKEERKQRKRTAEKKLSDIYEDINTYSEKGVISDTLKTISEKRGAKVKKLLHASDTTMLDREAIQREIACLRNQIVNVSKYDIENSKQMLQLLGIPFFDSDTEAETLCASLCCLNQVDAVLSDDTDVLVYGTPIFLTKINIKQETCIQLQYMDILSLLNLTPLQFTDLCIMSGTDYNDNIYNIGTDKAYKMIVKSGSLDVIETERSDTEILNFKRVREIFTVPIDTPAYKLDSVCPKLDDFITFAEHHGIILTQTRIDSIMNIVSQFKESM